MEALRKLDVQFGRIERARRFAPRPYEIVVLSDHGQTQGATFKQRNGYGLDELVAPVGRARRRRASRGRRRERPRPPRTRSARRPAAARRRRPKNDVSDQDVVVLGSGNLGLVYLMEERRRLTREEIDERHPRLLPALREHPHVGWLLVHSSEHGAVVARRERHALPRRRTRRGRGSAGAVLAARAAASPARRRLRARRGRDHRQLLRPRARGGLRVRGADLVPRRPRRPADAAVPALPGRARRLRRSRSSARRPSTACSWTGGGRSTEPRIRR